MNADQTRALADLAAAAEKRDAAEAAWRLRIREVDTLLSHAEQMGVATGTLARTARVSRQYLWKRAKIAASRAARA